MDIFWSNPAEVGPAFQSARLQMAREEEEGDLIFAEQEKNRCINQAKKSRGSSESAVPKLGLEKAG